MHSYLSTLGSHVNGVRRVSLCC